MLNNDPYSSPSPRILCAVYTHEKRHSQVQAIIDTWGWRCDGFFAASTLTNTTLGAINLTHIGEESYENMWQKIRSIWAYVYDHYMEDFDYFYLGGDDVHVIVENLREYLRSISFSIGEERTLNDALYLGQHVPIRETEQYFVGGAPGYVINKVTLKRAIEEALPTCYADAKYIEDDRLMSLCLEHIGIYGNDTADSEGKQRFHTADAEYLANYDGQRGYFKLLYDYWGNKHGLKAKADIVSSQSVSFHLLNTPLKMKRHHAIIYRSCPTSSNLASSIFVEETFNTLAKHNISTDFINYKLVQLHSEANESP